MNDLYTLENARKYQWASITGQLDSERRVRLDEDLLGTRILDAGCGGGAYVDYLVQKGLDVTGVDKNPCFLDQSKENRLAGRFVEGDITALPFGNKSFDTTYCFDVLEHVDDFAAIKELARVTTRRLILAVPKEDDVLHEYGFTFAHYRDLTHLRYYTESSFEALIRTIEPTKIRILPQVPLAFQLLFKGMRRAPLKSSPLPHVTITHHIAGRRITNRLYTAIANSKHIRNAYRWVALAYEQKMEEADYYKTVYTGLTAVVDL